MEAIGINHHINKKTINFGKSQQNRLWANDAKVTISAPHWSNGLSNSKTVTETQFESDLRTLKDTKFC